MHMQIGNHASCTCTLLGQCSGRGRTPLHPRPKRRADKLSSVSPPGTH